MALYWSINERNFYLNGDNIVTAVIEEEYIK